MRFIELAKIRPLIRDFSRLSPGQASLALALMILSSFSSGIGILLIIPLMSSVGINLGDTTYPSSAGAQIETAFNSLGINPDLKAILIIYVMLITGVALLNYLNAIVSARLRRNFIVQLRDQLFGSLLRAEWQYLSSQRVADFARMVTGQVQSMGFTIFLILRLFTRLVLVLVYLAISLWLSQAMTALAFFCALGLVVIMLPLNKRIDGSGRQELKSYSDIFHSVFEQFYSLKIIKGFSAESAYIERMGKVNQSLEDQKVRIARYNAFSSFVFLSGAAVIFSLLFFIAIQILKIPLTNLLLILFIFSRLMPQFSSIQTICQQLIHDAPTYLDLIEKSKELNQHQENGSGEKAAPPFKKQLQLKNLSYRYPEAQESVFEKLDLTIEHNQSIALCGPSGVGKSTLADIIAGLLPPSSGTLEADGIEIDTDNRLAWRRNVAYVTQEVVLFDESIRANMSWVTKKALTDEQIWHCLELAAADFVRELPDQLDTNIGDRGLKLSGGERQRLALARALITEPEILILDEATSALDTDNEQRIRDALKNLKGKITLIVIAHDQDSIAYVDKRIQLTDFS